MRIKIFIALIIYISFAYTGFAQTFSGFGIKGGITSSFITGADRSYGFGSTDSKSGFVAGIFVEFFKVKKFSLITEINFEQKGADFSDYHNNPEDYASLKILSIPVFTQLTFPLGKVDPYISAGPRVDILLSKGTTKFDELYYKYINSVNFGISINAGTEFEINKKISLLAEGSYSPDLTTYGLPTVTHDLPIKNISMEFRLGLKFNI